MIEKGLYNFCVSACIFMIIFSLSINFIEIIDVFGSNENPIGNSGVNATAKKAARGYNMIDFLSNPLTVISSIGLLFAGGLSLMSGNANIFGVALFTSIFWGAWLESSSAFSYGGTSYGNWFSNPAMGAIYLIISVIMIFIFSGAVVGMLSGTE